MSNLKHRLNRESSQIDVNVDGFTKIKLESNSNLLPIGDVEKVINSAEQFNKERSESPYYRLSGSINPLFTNVLFNNTGVSSWASFNEIIFRDRTFPSNGTTALDDEDLTYTESIDYHLKEKNGWLGYKNPDISKGNVCTWFDMEPNRTKFSLSTENGIKNWELSVTYPIESESKSGDLTYNGLLIINSKITIIGGRNMLTYTTPVKHGLSQGESVRLKFSESADVNDGIYTVIRLGDDNGDNKEYHFTVDISTTAIIGSNSRMTRMYNGMPSIYYFRKFKKIKVRDTQLEMEDDDYEIFPLAFSQNMFEDKINHFVINEDIDISNLVDNLGRPLSEIYLTLIKTDSDGIFTSIKSGIDIPFINGSTIVGLPNIRLITASPSSNTPIDTDVKITDSIFYGDIAEYNTIELTEKILGTINHTFNTINRDNTTKTLSNVDFSGKTVELGVRYESYIYNPHKRIKIREYSSYIEQGTISTIDMPSYAFGVGDGRYYWRDLLDVGINDVKENLLDYPFLNGAHHINTDFSFKLKRQDPFNLYGLQYTGFPSEISGNLMDDKVIIKTSQDVC